jgi:hypothetical protein
MTTEERQILMYGMTEEEVRNEPIFKMDKPDEDIGYAMNILSDAQHMMECGNYEVARQFINKAKYWMSKAKSEIREAECQNQ